MAAPPPYPGTPRWLRIFVGAAGTVALMLVLLAHMAGGPSHNMPIFGKLDHGATHAVQESDR